MCCTYVSVFMGKYKESAMKGLEQPSLQMSNTPLEVREEITGSGVKIEQDGGRLLIHIHPHIYKWAQACKCYEKIYKSIHRTVNQVCIFQCNP